jgi:hypothetical protein
MIFDGYRQAFILIKKMLQEEMMNCRPQYSSVFNGDLILPTSFPILITYKSTG